MDLLCYLGDVYRRRAGTCSPSVSRHYGLGKWTRYEFECVQARERSQTSS